MIRHTKNYLTILGSKFRKTLGDKRLLLLIVCFSLYWLVFGSASPTTAYGLGAVTLTRSIVEDFDLDILNQHAPGITQPWAGPGVSFVGIPFYLLAKYLLANYVHFMDEEFIRYCGAPFAYNFMFFFGICFYSLLTFVMIYKMCLKFSSKNVAFAVTLAAFFASPLGFYSNDLFHIEHAVETFSVTLALYIWMTKVRSLKSASILYDFLLGASNGLAVLSKYTAGMFSLVFMGWYWFKKLYKRLLFFLVPFGASAVFLLWYLLSGYGHSYEEYSFIRPPLWVFDLLLNPMHKGFFAFHPVYLAAFYGLYVLWKRDRELAVLASAMLASSYLFFGGWIGYDPGIGVDFSARFLVSTVPILSIGLAAALEKYKQNLIFIALFTVAALYSSLIFAAHVLHIRRAFPKSLYFDYFLYIYDSISNGRIINEVTENLLGSNLRFFWPPIGAIVILGFSCLLTVIIVKNYLLKIPKEKSMYSNR